MAEKPKEPAGADVSDEELRRLLDEHDSDAREYLKRCSSLDARLAAGGRLTEEEQNERVHLTRLLEQSRRLDAQNLFSLVQTYASILEAVATGSMGYADLELNAHYLKIVDLIHLFLASPQMEDSPLEFGPAVDHVLPGTGIDVAWEDVIQPEVHELLSNVQEYALSNAPLPNEEESPLAIPPAVIATVCHRANKAITRYRAKVERRFQGVVERIEAKHLPGLTDRKAAWLVDTINELLQCVHVHREQFLDDKELSTLDSLGRKMNRLAVALDLTTPDRPMYYSYRAQPMVGGLGPITNPTWPGYFPAKGEKSGFFVDPDEKWVKRVHGLRDKATAIARGASDGEAPHEPASGAPEPRKEPMAEKQDEGDAHFDEEMREYDRERWSEIEAAFHEGRLSPAHVNDAGHYWLVGPKEYAVARLDGYPTEEEVASRLALSLSVLTSAAESRGLNSYKIAEADDVVVRYSKQALRILSDQNREMDALATTVALGEYAAGQGPSSDERGVFKKGYAEFCRLMCQIGDEIRRLSADQGEELQEDAEGELASSSAPSQVRQVPSSPPEASLANTIDELHRHFSDVRSQAAGIRLGILVANLDKPFSSWEEEESVAEQAWAAIPKANGVSDGNAGPPGPPSERTLCHVDLDIPCKPVLSGWADRHWLGRIGVWGGSDVQRRLRQWGFEKAANRLIPSLGATPQSRDLYLKWDTLYTKLTAWPLMEVTHDRNGHPEGHIELAWEVLLATIGMMAGSPIREHRFEIKALGERARCWYFDVQPCETSLLALRYIAYYCTAPLSAQDIGLLNGAVTFGDLARLVELVDDRRKRDGWCSEVDDLVECIRASARAMRPLGMQLLGRTLYEEFLDELQTAVTFCEVSVLDDGGEVSGVVWGAHDDQMQALIQKLTEWHERGKAPTQSPPAQPNHKSSKGSAGRPQIDLAHRRVCTPDGEWHDVSPAQMTMLKALFEAQGGWVQGKSIRVSRADKTRSGMPKAVRRMIESHNPNGYRIPTLLSH